MVVSYCWKVFKIISTSFLGKVENMGKFENNVSDIGQCRVVIIIIIIIIIIITLLLS